MLGSAGSRAFCGNLRLFGPRRYNYLVRIKTSITLPEDLLKSIDRTGPNRSAFIERASRAYLARLEKLKREQRDVEIINAHSRRMNAEAMDVISYQSPHYRY